jgi:hypothetical protein
MNLLRYVLFIALMGCAPPAVTFQFTPTTTSPLNLARVFPDVLQYYKIQFSKGTSFEYTGTDERAFLAVVDSFYLEVPGYCPMIDGYHVSSTGFWQMTLAAKDKGVRALIYNLNQKPKFEYAILEGQSLEPLPTRPCSTAKR